MNISICLDQYASNYNLNALSSNGFSIYTDLDNFTTPIAQGIPYQNLFSPPVGNCPYLLTNVPAGVTQLLVIDNCSSNPISETGTPPTSQELLIDCCYALIDVPPTPPTPVSFCTTCSLDFDVFNSSSVGQIIAGNLTSTCGTITDYTIGWYLDGDYSSPVFISGYGNAFLPYQNLHPLTGNSAVPALAGDWEGIIHDVAINGVIYSSVSGSANGQPIPFESCFDTIVVEPLQCDNGTFSAKYSHQFTFNSQAVGTVSAPVSLTYALNSTTKYFAYLFSAFNVWDEIEIKWKSGNPAVTPNPTLFSQPIYLEKIKRGNDLPNPTYPINPTTTPHLPTYPAQPFNDVWPKLSPTLSSTYPYSYGFQRVLTLTNLPTSSNPSFPDLLEITITPNPINNNTQWQAAFQCLEDFDCTNCHFNDWPDSLPKISHVVLDKVDPTQGCDGQRLAINVSGCINNSDLFSSNNPLTSFNGTLVGSNQDASLTSPRYAPSSGVYVPLIPTVSCTWNFQNEPNCATSSLGTITLNKIPNQIQLTFNLYADYQHYKNSLTAAFNTLSSNNSTNITSPIPCPAGSTSLDYYKYFELVIPIQPTSTANCGDNTIKKTYNFHINDYFNITYTNDNNPSATSWSITIPQSSMVNCFANVNCNDCDTVAQMLINQYNTGGQQDSLSFTTTVGAKYQTPFRPIYLFQLYSNPVQSGSVCYEFERINQFIPWYSINTIPFIQSTSSPTGWVNLPSLGGSLPCDLTPYPTDRYTYFPNSGWMYLTSIVAYQARFLNLTSSGYDCSLSTNDFEIYSYIGFGNTGSLNQTQNVWPIPCPDPSGSLIYSYIGGVATVHTSSYFVGGNPTLIVDPYC